MLTPPPHPHAFAAQVVIGGGPSGVLSARELLRAGFDVDVLEAGPAIGGVWDYTPASDADPLGRSSEGRVYSSMYESLRTNLPREIMGLTDLHFGPGFPGSVDPRQYPSHREVLAFVRAIADHGGVTPHVRTNAKVVKLAREQASDAAAPRWRVDWEEAGAGPAATGAAAAASTRTNKAYEFAVVANGHHTVPVLPSIPGEETFPGLVLHAHNYRVPAPFAGQTVVVLGAASSGTDISVEIAGVAKRVLLSGRGLEDGPDGAAPGGATRRSVLVGLGADGSARFADGAVEPKVDAVIYCTGYRYALPFLDASVPVSTHADNFVGPLWKHLLVPDGDRAPSLALVGLPFKVNFFVLAELQSKLVARAFSGAVQLPPPATILAEAKDRAREAEQHGFEMRHVHNLALPQSGEQWRYDDEIAAIAGVSGIPPWMPPLYDAAADARGSKPELYRDLPLKGVDEELQEARATWKNKWWNHEQGVGGE